MMQQSDNFREYLESKSKKELISLLVMQKEEKVPIGIFKNDIPPLGALVKYLKEEKNWTITKIANKIGRTPCAIWITYNNCKRKKIIYFDAKYEIPISAFDNNCSVLENVVWNMKHSTELNYHQIAQLIKRDDRTVWTVYKRAEVKLNGRR